ncbi:hypothetical protein [Kribbella sp. NPDC000426]|uniref:hypothetical protein n=1 Tax=Kribbella sp. NPDC000426 TaxID=3154255 RepID=UPI003323B1E6
MRLRRSHPDKPGLTRQQAQGRLRLRGEGRPAAHPRARRSAPGHGGALVEARPAPESAAAGVSRNGAYHELDADAVNGRFQELVGADYTVKDLRTWTATVHAASYVDPRVIEQYEHGHTIAGAVHRAGTNLENAQVRATLERSVSRLLNVRMR